MNAFKVDPEFRDMIRPLTDDERAGLEKNLKANGCLNPLIVWNGILLDGHNRYELCREHGIKFDVKHIELAKLAGVGHDTIAKAKVIAAEAPEEVKQQLRKGQTKQVCNVADLSSATHHKRST